MNHQQDRDGSPAPDDIPFNEGDWSPITVEHIRFVCGAGYLNIARVLDPLMQQRRWMDTTGYLRRAFKFHRTEALAMGPAVPSPGRDIWDFHWTHPELYVLTHAQNALEVAGQGNLLWARERWDDLNEVINWTTQNSSGRHGRFIRDIRSMELLSSVVTEGYRFTEDVVAPARLRTCVAIREYLNVYLPEASGRLQVMNADGDWQFPDDMGICCCSAAWCVMSSAPATSTVCVPTLRQRCPASTPCVRDRLKQFRPLYANMRLRDNGAGPSGGTGGAPGTGAPVT